MNEAIKQTLNTPGWQFIEEMIKSKITEVRLARNINKKRSYNDLAIDVLSKSRAANKMLSILKKLDSIKNQKQLEKESWK